MSVSREELFRVANGYIDIGDEPDCVKRDCDFLCYLFENCEIILPENNRFFVDVNCEGLAWHLTYNRADKFHKEVEDNGLKAGEKALAHTGNWDYSHTTTDWQELINIGICGVVARLEDYLEKYSNDPKRVRFYSNLLRVWKSAIAFMNRAAGNAREMGKEEMAKGIENLTKNPPKTLFEAMQLTIIYYYLQHMFEGTNLRTLGRLDTLFYPFYQKEDKNEAKKLLVSYLQEIDRLRAPSNIPFAIGGTDMEGNDLINELSYEILAAYRVAETNNTKFHFLCSKKTPADIILKGLDAVREGNNSIVFMSDEKIIESLEKLGAEKKDAIDYHIVGCYEAGAMGELTCTCNGRVNLPKALELALNNGYDIIFGNQISPTNDGDFATFEELYAEFLRQVEYCSKAAMKATDIFESHYDVVHSAPILSATYSTALEKGGDLYCSYAAKYNNSSVNAIGLATAVDSLMAIKKIVYEDKTKTISEFAELLRNDWQGEEVLRLTAKNKCKKFGTADPEADALAKDIVDFLAKTISGKPNAKGGVWRLGLFSINWRHEMGGTTAASADGRHIHDTLSQNASATFGADKLGATAHLISVAAIDASNTPNGTIVDIDMHSSSVKGENGLAAMKASLMTYFELGGFGVHYNVLDTETLIDAKKNPDKYPNLQVRLCGWNVLFNTLSEKDKDEFIARSMK